MVSNGLETMRWAVALTEIDPIKSVRTTKMLRGNIFGLRGGWHSAHLACLRKTAFMQGLAQRKRARDNCVTSAMTISPLRLSRRIVFREGIGRPGALFPVRDRCLAARSRHEARALDELRVVNVARRIRKYARHRDANDELRFRKLRSQRIVEHDACFA